ncbi:NAD(P)-dependent dehydrogenase (short-subunit alcohol dehydrogenase family) [Nocardia sp. GAS34]|uniref:SDR family NAD(P)-dependent oxidoreductase n=1 Tax=unclassified Nocardia TaxID=2637762 RepID=UPI003D1EB72A
MTLITTPFGPHSTAAEVAAGTDLSGKRAIVTGASSGLGVETARILAAAGAEVTLAVRDLTAGASVAAAITESTGNAHVRVASLELADRSSIASFVADWTGPLHILVNNAGVMALPELRRTPQGWETQFTVNHLGHFALTVGLHGALAAADGARVVAVSSSGHLLSPVVFDDIHFDFRSYDAHAAYGQSKTANILFAVAAAVRWAGDGIAVNAIAPGSVPTNLVRHQGRPAGITLEEGLRKTVEQGAATTILAATSPLLKGVSGHYFADCAEAHPVTRRPSMAPVTTEFMNGVAPYALDPAGADRLWEESARLVSGRG